MSKLSRLEAELKTKTTKERLFYLFDFLKDIDHKDDVDILIENINNRPIPNIDSNRYSDLIDTCFTWASLPKGGNYWRSIKALFLEYERVWAQED
jgi:hypothetical protein